jgi:hypothetical protein
VVAVPVQISVAVPAQGDWAVELAVEKLAVEATQLQTLAAAAAVAMKYLQAATEAQAS